jgi:hypothetical protein
VSYITPIRRLTGDNLAGLLQLQVCRAADIVSIPEPVNNVVYGNIVFAAGAGMAVWDVTLESPKIESRKSVTKEGTTTANTLPFSIPKDTAAIGDMLKRMEQDEFIVLFKYSNGDQKIFGLKHAPVRFSYDHDSGDSFSSKNAYDCRFFYQGPDNIFFYPGTGGVAPTGPAPVVVLLNGQPWFSANPGQTVNVQSDFDFTDLEYIIS